MLMALIAMVVFAGLYFGFLGFIGEWINGLRVETEPVVLLLVFTIFSVIYAFVFFKILRLLREFAVIHRRGVFSSGSEALQHRRPALVQGSPTSSSISAARAG
jgi:hypothetical protein